MPFACSLQGEYVLLWHNPVSVNNGLPPFIVTIANSKGGYGRSFFWEMCYPHRTLNSFFPTLQSSCKGVGWIWIQRTRFPPLPIPQIKGSGLLQPWSTCLLITKDTSCPPSLSLPIIGIMLCRAFAPLEGALHPPLT